jgi:hypothetical protein
METLNAHHRSRADGLPQPRRKDNEHECGKSVSELEKDMLQAFKEQEDLSSENIPNPPHSHRLSSEPACVQVDQEADQSVPEVLRDASPLRTQSQKETDVIPIFLGQLPQEKAADGVREVKTAAASLSKQSRPKGGRMRGRQKKWAAILNSPNAELPVKS